MAPQISSGSSALPIAPRKGAHIDPGLGLEPDPISFHKLGKGIHKHTWLQLTGHYELFKMCTCQNMPIVNWHAIILTQNTCGATPRLRPITLSVTPSDPILILLLLQHWRRSFDLEHFFVSVFWAASQKIPNQSTQTENLGMSHTAWTTQLSLSKSEWWFLWRELLSRLWNQRAFSMMQTNSPILT